MVEAEALEKNDEMANRYGGAVKADLEVAMNATRTMAQMFEGIKANVAEPLVDYDKPGTESLMRFAPIRIGKTKTPCEEFASASEDMSAQVEHMKAFVGDLLALVYGPGKDTLRHLVPEKEPAVRKLRFLQPKRCGRLFRREMKPSRRNSSSPWKMRTSRTSDHRFTE